MRLYPRLVGAHLRAILQYERDFWILAVSTLLMQTANIVFLTALFAKVPHINGWSYWSMVMLTNLVTGALMISVAVAHVDLDWSVSRAVLAVLLVVTAVVVRLAINLVANAASFWLDSPTSLLPSAVARAGELGRYPLSIYPTAVKAVLGLVVPLLIFRRGLRRYESTGS